jgi:hypothetical protein
VVVLLSSSVAAATAPRQDQAAGARDVRIIVTDGVRPLAGARVRVDSLREVLTDSTGVVRVSVPAGRARALTVRALGFTPATIRVDASRDTVRVVTLTPTVQALPGVDIEAAASGPREFQRRARVGIGRFLTREELQRRRAPNLSAALVGTAGWSVVGQGVTTAVVLRDDYGRLCEPTYWVDGIRVTYGAQPYTYRQRVSRYTEALQGIPIDEIAGVELYRRPGVGPPQFEALDGCGVIVIWTRNYLEPRVP